jgi:hypothetical protein
MQGLTLGDQLEVFVKTVKIDKVTCQMGQKFQQYLARYKHEFDITMIVITVIVITMIVMIVIVVIEFDCDLLFNP